MSKDTDDDSIIVKWETVVVKADVEREDTNSEKSKSLSELSDDERVTKKFRGSDELHAITSDVSDDEDSTFTGQENKNSNNLDSDDVSDSDDDTLTDSIGIINTKSQKDFPEQNDLESINVIDDNKSDEVETNIKNKYSNNKNFIKSQPVLQQKKKEMKVTPSNVREQKSCGLNNCTLNHKEVFTVSKCCHTFFRDCLSKTILARKNLTFMCPFKTQYASCNNSILEADIKKILSPNDFDEYLTQSLLIAEKQSENAFHCKTPGCIGWCIYEKNSTIFQCLVCKKTNCLLCKTIHLTRPCKKLDNLLNYPNENNTASLARSKNNALKLYPKLLDLYRAELVLYPEQFDCSICFDTFFPMEGVILKNCLHVFCRPCLQKQIRLSDTVDVKCPYVDDDYGCESVLFEYEIKALLSPREYEERLRKTFIIAESKMDNTFHCKTADCKGWCIVEDGAHEFICYICGKLNCTICAVIHQGQSCHDYQDRLHTNVRTDNEGARSEAQIQEIINRGDAMRCPKCHVLIMKTEGCDGITCPRCETDICWITKRRRWGPKGKGDWSGGCRCNYNGIKCHPRCGNCH